MDPPFVTNELWHDISTMLRFLWVYLLLIIGFAFNFLLAHAIFPSLVASGHLPARIARLRPLFYLGAFGILAMALVFLVLTMLQADVVGRLWERWWI